MSDMVKASHILLAYEGAMRSRATRSKDEALEQIKTLKAEIADGADFGEVATENSDCPSASDGGDLGMFSKGQMVPEFDAAVFSMEVGDTSDVVETDFGYHLIHRTA